MENARKLAQKGIHLVEKSSDIPLLAWCYICLARVRFSSGDFKGAQDAIRSNHKLFPGSYAPLWIQYINDDWQVRIWSALEQKERMLQWADGIESKSMHECPYNEGIQILNTRPRTHKRG